MLMGSTGGSRRSSRLAAYCVQCMHCQVEAWCLQGGTVTLNSQYQLLSTCIRAAGWSRNGLQCAHQVQQMAALLWREECFDQKGARRPCQASDTAPPFLLQHRQSMQWAAR